MSRLSVDIETYSSVDIKKAGLYRYVQAPDFQVLLFAYSLDGQPVQVVDLAQGEAIPPHILQALFDPAVEKRAWNAAFEWYALGRHFSLPHNQLLTWLAQWRCSMIHAYYCGYPGSLAAAGEAVGISADKKKLSVGGALIRTFCAPQKPTKANGGRTRTLPHHEPEKWQLFKQYCAGDVAAEIAIADKLDAFPVPEQEWALWRIDMAINERGVECDWNLVWSAVRMLETESYALVSEAIGLTGIENPRSVQQLISWLEEETGEEVADLRKGTVAKMVEKLEPGKARRVLEIRQELSKSSTKKYAAMRETICDDGRIRGLLQFYGANRTGRWAGRLVQVQNLPRNSLPAIELARTLAARGEAASLKLLYGSLSDTLSQLIRTALIARPHTRLHVADFSAIEARVLAWLAGEQWRIDVFRTHGKIYEASASQMFSVPIESITKGSELRQKGKIAELALGYQGGVGALVAMGALDMGLSEDELPEIVERWRNANRAIVGFWRSIEGAALHAVQTGEAVGLRGLVIAREMDSRTGQDFLTIRLHSGRKLYYPRPHVVENQFGRPAVHYHGTEGGKWTVLSTYGGKLTENVVQAISRDCLANAMMKLDAAGFEIVMHVHDEVVAEVEGDRLEEMLELMREPIPWAPGLPLEAAGFVADFYMKD
jgi:DNA polymerase I - 3''-5'' exonuclease and polymerase domains